MKNIYLGLAIVGAIVPYVFFAQHLAQTGLDLVAFIEDVFANPAASGFTADLLISSFVFWIAMIVRQRTGSGPGPLLFIILNLTIGLSCALPAYLYANELRKGSDVNTLLTQN
jgi:hypothetical protein